MSKRAELKELQFIVTQRPKQRELAEKSARINAPSSSFMEGMA
jgi:hypothetical protein